MPKRIYPILAALAISIFAITVIATGPDANTAVIGGTFDKVNGADGVTPTHRSDDEVFHFVDEMIGRGFECGAPGCIPK
ncbi:MAG: hypothetical protein ACI81L_000267 [Verrucomicrobiales bacterium]|jgi:hypothetical protein